MRYSQEAATGVRLPVIDQHFPDTLGEERVPAKNTYTPDYNVYLRSPTASSLLPYVMAPVEEGSVSIFSPRILTFVTKPERELHVGVTHKTPAQMVDTGYIGAPLELSDLKISIVEALGLKVDDSALIVRSSASHAQQAQACLQLARLAVSRRRGLDVIAVHGLYGLDVIHFGQALPAQTRQTAIPGTFGLAAGG